MATRVPPVNATLTRVWAREQVGEDDYFNAVYADVETFTGAAPAYVTERNEFEVTDSGGRLRNYTAQVVIPSDVPVEVGHKLAITRRGVQTVREVDAVEDRSDFGFTRCYVKEIQ
jgi:outer membrane scaffolding protein for murein synthesis (MipA/OmpV family)